MPKIFPSIVKQGATGAQGIQGSPGVTGSAGSAGSQGIQGSPGLTGTQGPQGPQGSQGSPGVTGSQGIQGSPGITGVTGPTGPQGNAGSQGATGPTGPAGAQGPTGAAGSFNSFANFGGTGSASGAFGISFGPTGRYVPWNVEFYKRGNIGHTTIGTCQPAQIVLLSAGVWQFCYQLAITGVASGYMAQARIGAIGTAGNILNGTLIPQSVSIGYAQNRMGNLQSDFIVSLASGAVVEIFAHTIGSGSTIGNGGILYATGSSLAIEQIN